MGQKDKLLSAYINRESVMADLYNGVLYEGRPVISPRDLGDVQTFSREIFCAGNGKSRRVSRQRDAMKLLHRNGRFILLAAENQDRANFRMPLRCAEYDVAEYIKQFRRLKMMHDRQKDLKTPEEILSGMTASDRLIPVVTLVLYHGDGKWEAADRLNGILDQGALDDPLQTLLQDYHIRVVNLTDLDETRFQTNLRELIGLMKRRGDRKAFTAYLQENQERFASMDADAYDMLCAMLGMKSLEINRERYRNKEDKLNMNTAFEEWGKMLKAEGKAEGRASGEKIGRKHGERIGEERLGRLMTLLLGEERFKDAAAAAKSARVRSKLYKEYGI